MEIQNEYKTKTRVVYETIRDAIISGNLRPATRIIIRTIAMELHVSETPVREALRQLESDGLVESVPYVGTIVSTPSIENLEEVMVIRANLEPLAAELSAPKLTESDINRLTEIIEGMARYEESGDFWEYSNLDRKFHRLLYSRCNNDKLLTLITELHSQSERARGVFRVATRSAKQSLNEHRAMLDAVRAKDTARLKDLIRLQTNRVSSELKNLAGKLGSLL